MKKIISLIICFVLLGSAFAFANEAPKDSASSYTEDKEGSITVTTVYNLDILAPEHIPEYIKEKSDESEAEQSVINERVSHRAKNAIVIQIGNYAAVSNDLLEWIDKDNKKVIPYIEENRTMVPLRYIAEKLGAEVGYDEAKKEVSITLGEDVFKVVIDDTKYTLNGKEYTLDAPAEIKENRTFVPLRVISEAFNKDVKLI